jgi:hypothetical protein
MFALVMATVALAAYFGYIASLEAERNPPERRGVRLHVLKIRR